MEVVGYAVAVAKNCYVDLNPQLALEVSESRWKSDVAERE